MEAHCELNCAATRSRIVILPFACWKLLSDLLWTLCFLIAVVIYRWNVASLIYNASVEVWIKRNRFMTTDITLN